MFKKLKEKEICELAQKWLQLDRNHETRARIQDLLNRKDWDTLESLIGNPLQFGTAGLRAAMDAGFARMNDLTVLQATQGLCQYILSCKVEATSKGVVIGHDHRHHSKDFARLTAGMFLIHGIPVFYFADLVHTPLVPFAVRHFKAACGVMITASHNPKQDNGYKLYWDNACQVITPHDKHIQNEITKVTAPKIWSLDLVETHPLSKAIPRAIIDDYFDKIASLSLFKQFSLKNSDLKIVYTAMHGVGYPFAVEAIKRFHLPSLISVKEQEKPDPEFSTVKYPNPEEGAGALTLAMRTADEHGAIIILANDPDADRLAVAEKVDGKWMVFNGNEIGSILAGHLWDSYNGKTKGKVAMLASAVSSKMISAIACKEGFAFEETLTGFKWIGNKALDLEKEEITVLFAFEEAIGYMISTLVPDKDGISALGVVAELSHKLYSRGSSLHEYLHSLYERYGYFMSSNSYFISQDSEKTNEMFNLIRYGNKEGGKDLKYPDSIGKFPIKQIRDLTVGYDSSTNDKKPILPCSKSSQMITFKVAYVEDESIEATITLRTSGTEPKIKYYSEINGKNSDREKIAKILQLLVDDICNHLYRPSEFGFKARGE